MIVRPDAASFKRRLRGGFAAVLIVCMLDPPGAAAAKERPAADAPAAGTQATARVDFGRQVQPLLAKRCYKCHGPDQGEGGLRLNEHEAALAELDSGAHAIVPGRPAISVRAPSGAMRHSFPPRSVTRKSPPGMNATDHG